MEDDLSARIEAWGIGNDIDRDRYKLAKKEETELVSFRCPKRLLRMLDIILQNGLDPRLETKTDCYVDAVFMFAEHWSETYKDGPFSGMLRQVNMMRMEMAEERRSGFLRQVDERMDAARLYGDNKALANILNYLYGEKEDHTGTETPISYVKELEDRIKRCERDLT